MFTPLHDSVYHPAYKELKRVHAEYAAVRAALDKATAAGDRGAADKKLDELTAVATRLSEQVPLYVHSSSASVEKIQIGLGVVAFVICGLFVLIFRRKKK